MARAGRWAAEQSRKEQQAFLREFWPWLTGITLVLLAASTGLLLWKPTVASGVTVGVLLSSWGWGLTIVIQQVTGTASTMMGANAERWTSEELFRLTKKGWAVFDAIPIDTHNRDLDHLAIGPPGVFAIETKWSGSDWFDPKQSWYLERCIDQARWRADKFTRMRSSFSLRDQPITPVLVLWGKGARTVARDQAVSTRGGVTVVAGPSLKEWTESLESAELSSETIQRAAGDLSAFLAKRDPHVLGEDPGRFIRGGLDKVVRDLTSGVAAAILGMASTGYLAARLAGNSLPAFFAACGSIIAASWGVWHFRRHPALFGWALGSTCVLPIIGVLLLGEQLG